MAITRKLVEVRITFDAVGATTTVSTAIVADDTEDTSTGVVKRWNAASVTAAANALRDAIVAQSLNQGKPVTF